MNVIAPKIDAIRTIIPGNVDIIVLVRLRLMVHILQPNF